MSKSVEELFKNAPADATYYAKCCHYKVVGDTWFVHMHDNEWITSDSMYNGQIKPSDIIARPTVKQWSGPEDGLPPVNTELLVVEGPACWEGESIEWIGETVTVKAVFLNEIKQNIVAVEKQGGFCDCFILECLAPIKTAEQIARDKRESAIRDVMDIAQVDCRVTAARLVDAGFKREVV